MRLKKIIKYTPMSECSERSMVGRGIRIIRDMEKFFSDNDVIQLRKVISVLSPSECKNISTAYPHLLNEKKRAIYNF